MDDTRGTPPFEVRLDVPEKTVKYWLEVSQRPTSLDVPLGEDGRESLGDTIGDTKAKSPFEELNDQLDQRQQEGIAHGPVEPPQPLCLRRGEPQARQLAELALDPLQRLPDAPGRTSPFHC